MNTPFRDTLASKPIQSTLKPKQASKAIHEPKSGCNIMLQKQLSPYENFQQFCQELEFRYALAAKAPSDPEVMKIMNEHSILNIMLQKHSHPMKTILLRWNNKSSPFQCSVKQKA